MPIIGRCIAVLAAAGSLLILASCGDDDREGGNDTTTTAVESKQAPGGSAGVSRPPGSGEHGASGQTVPPAVRQRREELDIRPGADNSLQTFGAEPEAKAQSEVVEAMREFLTALARGDYVGACNDFSESLRDSNEELIDRFRRTQGRPPARGCSDLGADLRLLSSGSGLSGQAERALNGQVLRVGVESGSGRTIVIISQEDGRLVHFPMVREDGRWKPYSIAPKPVRGG